MTYRRQIIAPFTGGINTDLPNWMISEKESVSAQDIIALFGIAQQRRGWVYDGTTADVASNLQSVTRNKFIIADVTRTLTSAANGNLYIHNPAGAGTQFYDGTATYLPRAVYRDEVLWCAQDGVSPLKRYSGASITGNITYTGTASITTGEATITGMTLASDPGVGSYSALDETSALTTPRVRLWHRTLESSTTSITMEDVISPLTIGLTASPGARFEPTGYAFPCVSIYNAGTVLFTASTDNLDGFGTKWTTGNITLRGDEADGSDGVLILVTSANPQFFQIITVTDDNDLQITGGNDVDIAKSNYMLLRRCPFTDVAVKDEALWGTGVEQYPNRVYVGPPGWNLALPPGASVPFTIPISWGQLESTDDYVLKTLDIPTPYDGDVNIALLPSSNPMLVIKGHSVFGIYGNYPTFSVNMIQDDCGALDIRGCQNLEMGPVWAGQNGIFTYQGGRIIDLTQKRINREWRNLVANYVPGTSTISIGEIRDHMFVSVKIGGGGATVTYVFDIKNGVWVSKFTNHHANYYFSTHVPGEKDDLYWVDGADHQGRVMKSATIFNNDHIFNKRDGDGVKPLMSCTSGRNLSGRGPEAETTLLDMSVVGRLFDAGAAGSTDIAVTSTAFDALTDTDGSIGQGFSSTSSTEATIDAVPRRMYTRNVNNRGRSHFFSFSVPIFDTDANAGGAIVDLGTATFTFEDTADRT